MYGVFVNDFQTLILFKIAIHDPQGDDTTVKYSSNDCSIVPYFSVSILNKINYQIVLYVICVMNLLRSLLLFTDYSKQQ